MPDILFLPGAGGSPDFWTPVARQMPPSWTTHRFSWPGLGDQAPDPAVRGMDDLAAMVLARMDTPVHLVAQSMGGVVAITAAGRRPKAVRSLTLCGTSGGLDVSTPGGADWRGDYRKEFPNAATWITGPQDDMAPQIAALSMPVLLLWGDCDRISPVAVGERLGTLAPRATLRIVTGGGHDFPVTHAAEIAPLIRRHIEAAG